MMGDELIPIDRIRGRAGHSVGGKPQMMAVHPVVGDGHGYFDEALSGLHAKRGRIGGPVPVEGESLAWVILGVAAEEPIFRLGAAKESGLDPIGSIQPYHLPVRVTSLRSVDRCEE